MFGVELSLLISKLFKNENTFFGTRILRNLYDLIISINSTEFEIKKKLLVKIKVA
jgi:hypothetical protein